MSPKSSNLISSPYCPSCPYPCATPPYDGGGGGGALGYASTATNTFTVRARYTKKVM